MATTATQKSRASASKPETSSSRHQRKCIICHHADREEIEQMFLHWFSASTIYRRFLLKDRSSIYDHAHATGLYSRRRKNMRCALENIIERSDECPISSNGIVRAIKAYCSLTTAGEWVEPASRVVYQTVSTSSAPTDPRSAGLPRAETGVSFTPSPEGPALFASVHPVYPDAGTNAGTASHTTVPSTTVDGWNCRYGDVRGTVLSSAHATAASASQNMSHSSSAPHSQNCNVGPDSVRAEGVRSTPLPSVSHITTTDAPVAPQKNPAQTTAAEALASSLATSHSPLLSNRYNKLLETPATRTKQRTGPRSNRYK
ncbi:MAG: hypothetical protein ACYDD2_12580 [Candidatus Acidiferrales bacterium]